MNFKLPKIYPITDVRLSGISHEEQVARLITGGATCIQLREKYLSPRDLYESAALSIKFARKCGVRIVINDRVDIALALKADGVHLGQDDLPPDKARNMLGPKAVIGYSTHSVEQAVAALTLPIDYIAIGPIFPSPTKENPDDIVGLDGLVEVRRAVGDFPLVAIGGINELNLLAVLDAHADSAAVIGALVSDHARIEARMQMLQKLSAD